MNDDKVLNEAFGLDEPASGRKWKEVDVNSGENWNFKEEKVINGVFKSERPVDTKFGTRSIYKIETPGGQLKDVWETAMIKRFFSQIPIGTEIRIEYLGKKENKAGQMVNHFKFSQAE